MKQILFSDNFKSYKQGDFPFEPFLGAMGEYHYRPKYWYGGQWYDPTPQAGSGAIMFWMITDIGEGEKCIEYAGRSIQTDETWQMLLVTGEYDWSDYEYSARVRTFRMKNTTGLAFRYQNSKQYYLLALNDGKLQLKKHTQSDITLLCEAPVDYDVDSFCILSASVEGDVIHCFFEGKEIMSMRDASYAAGKIGLATLAPAQFTDISVAMDSGVYSKICVSRDKKAVELAEERSKYPKPLLWKVIDFKNFGVGRSIRFGHLTGGKETHIVLAQNQRRISRDAFARISCLTAIDLDGRVLWQIGESDPENGPFITCDLPFQVYDIDGDGKDEVIYARDFRLIIAEGATGRTKKWMYTPFVPDRGEDDVPFDRLNVDFIRFCNFSGNDRPTDILIKDRYHHVWAYNADFELLWDFEAGVNTGHCPYAYDFNGDGRDELFVGYDLLSADGQKLWSADVHTDHTDEIVVGKLDPDGKPVIGIVSGWEGFMLLDFNGNIVARHNFGHAQRISVGKYRNDIKGLQIATVTYHKNQGIINLFDCKGNVLWTWEPGSSGNILTPVNWTGDGRDLILLNGNNKYGGMIDGYGRRVVLFPDDEHPDLCCEAIDLTGDGRDEIVLWDTKKMFIYTQDNVVNGTVDIPRKYPHYNASNYRGEYSYRD